MFTITAHPGVTITAYLDVKLIMHINQIDLTPYVTHITSKPHHIRFPKFTYVDEKFLGDSSLSPLNKITELLPLMPRVARYVSGSSAILKC